jgi:hypothetical protein
MQEGAQYRWIVSVTDDDGDIEREERAIYAIVAVICAPIVVAAGGVFDGGSTLGLLLTLVGLVGVGRLLRRPRFPSARIHVRRR